MPGAFDVIVNRPDNQVYVSARDGRFVGVLNGVTDTIVTKIFPQGNTFSLAYDPVRKQLYVVIDPDSPLTYLRRLPLYLPLPLSITQRIPNPKAIVVFEVKPNYDFGRSRTLWAGEAGPQGGIGIGVNPNTGHFFVSNTAENTLSIFDGVALMKIATTPMDGDPGHLAVHPVNNRVYISNRTANLVRMVIDTW